MSESGKSVIKAAFNIQR